MDPTKDQERDLESGYFIWVFLTSDLNNRTVQPEFPLLLE